MKPEFTYPELQGAVCVVTGAGGGIGRQICLDLARSGAYMAQTETAAAARFRALAQRVCQA